MQEIVHNKIPNEDFGASRCERPPPPGKESHFPEKEQHREGQEENKL